MQAINVVCFIIRVIVGGSILIIETVFAGSNEMNYILVGFPSKRTSFVTPNKFRSVQGRTFYKLANSLDVMNCVGGLYPQTNFRGRANLTFSHPDF